MSKRVPIPRSVQDTVLLANRHSCCVCQKPRVQLHHIDGNPSNNVSDNIAAVCTDHHDMASMTIGLTKKITPDQIRSYKHQWEHRCALDVLALSRNRFTFYYCIYKNLPRLLAAYSQLETGERKRAVKMLQSNLIEEQETKTNDSFFGSYAVPQDDSLTRTAMQSVYAGEQYPSYLKKFEPHPADPNYSRDCSTQEAMLAYHLYDLWCQVIAQVLAASRGTMPLEDFYGFDSEESFDAYSGQLVTFTLSIYGKGVKIPGMWETHPVGTLTARKTVNSILFRTRMQLRTMYLFSDTAAINLSRGRVSGLGILQGAVRLKDNEFEITVVPLIIGAGGGYLR